MPSKPTALEAQIFEAVQFIHVYFLLSSQTTLHISKEDLSRDSSGESISKEDEGNMGAMVTSTENHQQTLFLLPKELFYILLSRNTK